MPRTGEREETRDADCHVGAVPLLAMTRENGACAAYLALVHHPALSFRGPLCGPWESVSPVPHIPRVIASKRGPPNGGPLLRGNPVSFLLFLFSQL